MAAGNIVDPKMKHDGGRRGYVTFLAGDGDYVKGVVGLAKGLRKVEAQYPLMVAVLPDVPAEHRRMLVEQSCLVREIEPVYPPENFNEDKDKEPFAWAYYAVNYSKLRLWSFADYSKLIYLDADTQVFDYIDHLFDLPDGGFYAVVDCLCELHGQECAEKVPWPKEFGSKPPFYFNAGMFIFEPSLFTYHLLLKTLEVAPATPFAEQDCLNMFFRDTCKSISPVYNTLVAMLWRHPEDVEVEKAKIVHFCANGSKPWRHTGEEENMDREDIKMLVKKWWDIYDDEKLDYKRGFKATSVGSETLMFTMLKPPSAA